MKPPRMNFNALRNSRRGMLLLVVVLMLSLFMAAGAMLLTVALRARASARGFAENTLSTSLNQALSKAALDEALLTLLRGGTGANGQVITGTVVSNTAANPSPWVQSVWGTGTASENILHDKYGLPVNGTGVISGSNPVPIGSGSSVFNVFAVNVTAAGLTPARLGGRLLTIRPRRPEDGAISTHVILGASSSGGSVACFVANPPTLSIGQTLRPNATFDVVINGREFEAEAYDAYDDANTWLAHPVISGSSSPSGPLSQVVDFKRLTFTGSSPSLGGTVDNDLDGVADGVWIPPTLTSGSPSTLFVLPDRPSPLGGTVRYQVSYLVLDLDGRININAAGIASTPPTYGPENAPVGMGYGPADIDASLLFSGSLPSASGTSPFSNFAPYWLPLLTGSTTTLTGTNPPSGRQRTPPPLIGAVAGRYGLNNKPGYDDSVTATALLDSYPLLSISGSRSNYEMLFAGTNAVADMQGTSRLTTSTTSRIVTSNTGSQITPTLTFYLPVGGTSATHAAQLDRQESPYQARLGGAPRGDDQPFTLSELERVLRPFDGDAPTLPQRLAAGLGDHAQRSRMTITTDSWDTPALTGSAATLISSTLATLPALSYAPAAWTVSGSTRNLLSPDIAAGMRFNINRPLATAADSYEFCKDLYCLVRLVGGTNATTAAQAAQWAVNVLDFRDADSLMTGFEYDNDISNGWNVDGNLATTDDTNRGVVWGVERPEMVITETFAEQNKFWAVLHRPWSAQVITGTGSSAPAWATETVDPQLTTTGANTQPVTTGSNQLSLKGWQIRLLGSGTAALPPDQFIGVNDTIAVGTSISGTVRPIIVPLTPTVSGSVVLERLADPSKAFEIHTNPYVPVDQLSVLMVSATTTPKTKQVRAFSAPTQPWAFWNTTSGPVASDIPELPTSVRFPPDKTSWFHWPNRSFVSAVELALVPSDGGSDMLANFTLPTSSLVNSGSIVTSGSLVASGTITIPLGQLLLEATHVPSRFAGVAIPAGLPNAATNPLANYGFSKLHHMTAWREPGKTNVNTIISGTDGGAPGPDDVIWTTLIGGTATNPFASTPAKTIAELVAASPVTSGTIKRESFPSTDPRGRNPFFEYSFASRLANTATIRSQVFAVWITVRVTDDSPNAPPPITRRLFAIIDRSIPVGYKPGEDLNVSDCIRLKRYLD